jgi:hypothetical protein
MSDAFVSIAIVAFWTYMLVALRLCLKASIEQQEEE